MLLSFTFDLTHCVCSLLGRLCSDYARTILRRIASKRKAMAVLTVVFCFSFLPLTLKAADALPVQVINYGQIEIGLRKAYQRELLDQILSLTEEEFGPYELNFVTNTQGWSTARYLKILSEGEQINLSWGGIDHIQLDDIGLVRVPFPILIGINGYRISVLKSDNAHILGTVLTNSDLMRYRAGQVAGWAEIDILNYNNIPLEYAPLLSNLYGMLDKNRFDYLPLGMLEITEELNVTSKQYPDFVADDRLLIYYPSPMYFQVSDKYPRLAARITKGMKTATESGLVLALVKKHFASEISSLNLQSRHVLYFENPFLPEGFQETRPEQLMQILAD